MPLILALIPIALALAYFALRRDPADQADQVDQAPSSAGAVDDVLSLSAPPAVVADPFAGAVVLELGELAPLEVAAKNLRAPLSAAPYADAIATAERRYGIPDSLLARLLYEESRFRPDVISGQRRSSAGAIGIAQFMPATAAELGVNPLDPPQAIDGAARYLKQQFNRFGDWTRALAAYNWGAGNVQRRGMARAPAETRDYVAAILGDVEV